MICPLNKREYEALGERFLLVQLSQGTLWHRWEPENEAQPIIDYLPQAPDSFHSPLIILIFKMYLFIYVFIYIHIYKTSLGRLLDISIVNLYFLIHCAGKQSIEFFFLFSNQYEAQTPDSRLYSPLNIQIFKSMSSPGLSQDISIAKFIFSSPLNIYV